MEEQWSRQSVYRTDGSAAYDLAYQPLGSESTARPLETPERRQAPVRRPKPKTVHVKMAVAPLTVLGMMAAAMMLVLVLFGYVQIYESSSRVAAMEAQVQALQEEGDKLRDQYNRGFDLEEIESRARALGMQRASDKQKITLNIPVQDVTVISEETAENPVEAACRAIVETAKSLLEYLRLR